MKGLIVLMVLASALAGGSSEDVSATISRNLSNQIPTTTTQQKNRPPQTATATPPEASVRVSNDEITENWPEIQPEDKEDVFDWRLSQEIYKQNRKMNVLTSPISVKFLLTILAEGAGDDVESEMRNQLRTVLPYSKTLNDSRAYYKKVLASMGTKSDSYEISIGSKAYVRQGINASQKVKSILESSYGVSFETIDTKHPVDSAQKINTWIERITFGKITNLVDVESVKSAILLLLNAIYFRGLWVHPFENTMTSDFSMEPNVKVKKEFIHQVGNFHYFYSTEFKARFLRMPYEGKRFSMFLILPFEVDGLDHLITHLDADKIKQAVKRMEEISVNVTLPKFQFDTSLNLNSVVQSLGITEIFEDSATLPFFQSGQAGKLKVSNIIQKSGITVDEKGTEAQAATEIELIDKFGGDPREFIADHPFTFYIEDDTTGAKLFSGVVYNPEY